MAQTPKIISSSSLQHEEHQHEFIAGLCDFCPNEIPMTIHFSQSSPWPTMTQALVTKYEAILPQFQATHTIKQPLTPKKHLEFLSGLPSLCHQGPILFNSLDKIDKFYMLWLVIRIPVIATATEMRYNRSGPLCRTL